MSFSIATSRFLLFALLVATASHSAQANAFLRASPHNHSEQRLSTDAIDTTLLEEVEHVLGAGTTSSRLEGLKAMLQPIYSAVPKNEHGNLGHATVRYALHRLFLQRHGWAIKGLDRAGGAWNASSPTGVLKDQVPAYVQDLFEARLGGRGMGFQDLLIMAATIEHLIHNEAVGRLGEAYKVRQMPPSTPATEAEAHKLLDTYFMAFILGEDLSNLKPAEIEILDGEIHTLYLQWNETQKMVRRTLGEVLTAAGRSLEAGNLDFGILAKTAEKMGEDFGPFQDHECKELKTTLLGMGDYRTGRVRLSDFYKPALEGHWQFQENPSYLRQLGAIDDSNPSDPSVIVTNYLYSQSNCIASSSYYSVCCMDECEGLLSRVEQAVGAPQAEPEQLAALVSALPSSTVDAPRTLSNTLVSRLNEIASGHGGTVPLHGRLFAQWLHLAYPRECAYPHVAGTTEQQLPEEWQRVTGTDPTASHEEMQAYTTTTAQPSASSPASLDASSGLGDDDWCASAPWTPEEELLAVAPKARKGLPPCLRSATLIVVAFGLAVALLRSLLVGQQASAPGTEQKFFV